MEPVRSWRSLSVLILAVDVLQLAIWGRGDVRMVGGLVGCRRLLGEASEDLVVELRKVLVAGRQRWQSSDRRHGEREG